MATSMIVTYRISCNGGGGGGGLPPPPTNWASENFCSVLFYKLQGQMAST